MAILTIDKIKEEAMHVLETELGIEHPSEHHTLNARDGNKYVFQKYSTGWVLYNAATTKPLVENMTDEEMLAHLKLLRS